MAKINYLSHLDKINANRKYRPIIAYLTKHQLEILLMLLLNECELDYAFDLALTYPKEP